MIFYHADTHGLLKAGQFLELYRAKTPICDLYQSGTSSFGERAFMRPFDPAQRTMQIIDIVFDYVRLARFADKPSRFTSVFASLRLEDSKRWIEEIETGVSEKTDGCSVHSTPGISIYEVECDNAYIADARFLDCENALPDSQPVPVILLPFALEYWQSVRKVTEDTAFGYMNSYQKPEFLLVPPVHVLRRVDL